MSTFEAKPLGLIFGGRFDPPHLGHADVIEELIRDLNPAELRLLPVGRPAHKDCAASAEHRLEMLGQLVYGVPIKTQVRVKIDSREIERARRSEVATYSYETLVEMGAELGASNLAFVMGVDQLEDLPRWHRFPEILGLCHWIILERQPSGARRAQTAVRPLVQAGLLRAVDDRRLVGPRGMEIRILPTFARELASSDIRRSIALKGTPPDNTLSENVFAYIQTQRLYGASTPSATPDPSGT